MYQHYFHHQYQLMLSAYDDACLTNHKFYTNPSNASHSN